MLVSWTIDIFVPLLFRHMVEMYFRVPLKLVSPCYLSTSNTCHFHEEAFNSQYQFPPPTNTNDLGESLREDNIRRVLS